MEPSIFEVVKAYLIAKYRVPAHTIDCDRDVVSDLGLTLKELAELTEDLEKEYHIRFLDSEALYFRKVGQLVNFIAIKIRL